MTDTYERLKAVVEAEREALLAGDFERLSSLLEEKQGLAETIGEPEAEIGAVGSLRDAMQRNQVLFDRTLAGLRAVVTRLNDLSAVRKSMGTYDASGRRQSIPGQQKQSLERRA